MKLGLTFIAQSQSATPSLTKGTRRVAAAEATTAVARKDVAAGFSEDLACYQSEIETISDDYNDCMTGAGGRTLLADGADIVCPAIALLEVAHATRRLFFATSMGFLVNGWASLGFFDPFGMLANNESFDHLRSGIGSQKQKCVPKGSPTAAPTTSTSASPSISLSPSSSSAPSMNPSESRQPSSTPSQSSEPSSTPSESTQPSSKPSVSTRPSVKPSVSTRPSFQPSISSAPSTCGAANPTRAAGAKCGQPGQIGCNTCCYGTSGTPCPPTGPGSGNQGKVCPAAPSTPPSPPPFQNCPNTT